MLSPWYAPPTDREVIDTRTAVQKVLTAVTSAVRTLERREKQGAPGTPIGARCLGSIAR